MELKSGYKQTDVGVFPDDWAIWPLGRLFAFRNGINADKECYGHGVPFVNVLESITYSHIHGPEIVGKVTLPKSAITSYSVVQGDVLFNRTSETQEEVGLAAAYVGSEGVVFGGFVIRGRPTDDTLDPHYSGYALRAPYIRSQIIPMGQGAIRANISQSNLKLVLAPVPPRSEQRAIAKALGDVDALLGALGRLIAKKRDLNQAAMQQLLTGETRLPGFQGEWQIRPLSSDIEDLEAGISVNSSEEESDASFGGPAVLKTSAVSNGKFIPSECKPILQRDVARTKLSPRADSVIVSRMNTIELVGECGYVPRDFPSLFVPDRLWMTRFRPGSRISAKWLAFVLSSPASRRMIRNIASGTSGSMKNIGKEAFLAVQIAFPPPDEQAAIAAVLSDMDAELAALEARRDKTRALKQAVMQELLTGRTRLV